MHPCSIYHSWQSISGMPAASFTITDNPSYLYWDHTPLDFQSFFLSVLGILPWAFNGTMPWISIRDHPLGLVHSLDSLISCLVHSIYCPSFAWWKTSWQRPCILVKKGTFMGPMALWLVCLKIGLINGLLKVDLSQQEVLSPPFQVGIISQVLWSSIAIR